ncbi:MAG: hypothetical protein ABIN48_08850 [Ginsengibacter sp.]
MKEITLYIPEKKFPFFMELINSLDFVQKEVDTVTSKEQATKGFKEAVRQINLVKQGKLKARDARELLNEL